MCIVQIIRTYSALYQYTYIHRKYICINSNIHTHAYSACTYVWTYIFTYIQTCPTYIPTLTRTQPHKYMSAHLHIYACDHDTSSNTATTHVPSCVPDCTRSCEHRCCVWSGCTGCPSYWSTCVREKGAVFAPRTAS